MKEKSTKKGGSTNKGEPTMAKLTKKEKLKEIRKAKKVAEKHLKKVEGDYNYDKGRLWYVWKLVAVCSALATFFALLNAIHVLKGQSQSVIMAWVTAFFWAIATTIGFLYMYHQNTKYDLQEKKNLVLHARQLKERMHVYEQSVNK